jgi:hypothetical protein
MMRINELADGLTKSGRFAAVAEEGLLLVRSLEAESEYVIEEFDGSLQVRQAVSFDCFDMESEELLSIYDLCSKVNERFSGCKVFIDRWGTLLTGSDILSAVASIQFIEIILDQTEFISQAMLGLVESVRRQGAVVPDEDIDAALASPSLQ